MNNQKGNLGVIIVFIVVVVIIIFGVSSLLSKPMTPSDTNPTSIDTSKVATDSTATNQEQSSPTKKNMDSTKRLLPNFTPIAHVSKLEKIDTIVGKGEEVQPNAKVSVHYTGAVAATGVVFQSSKDFGTTPVTFPLNGVIKGWTDGIPGMKVGGTRRLIIPADQAYGANPPAGSGIPANADLVFDVELIAISK